jgi:hypothetical protein
MVILHCNDRTHCNAYLIALEVGHTYCIDPSSVGSTGGRLILGIFRSSAIAFNLMPFVVAKRGPLRLIFRVGNS